MFQNVLRVCCVTFVLGACAQVPTKNKYKGHTESERLSQFFEASFNAMLALSPEDEASLGIKTQQDKWDDTSESSLRKQLEMAKAQLQEIKTFEYSQLNDESKMSYDLFVLEMEKIQRGWPWRHYEYVVNQMFGRHSKLPSFLINFHSVSNEVDLKAYVARLKGFTKALSQVEDRLKTSEAIGVMPPKFVYPKVLSDIDNLQKGRPFDLSAKNSTLMADFMKKLNALKLPTERHEDFKAQGISALKNHVGPAYKQLAVLLKGMEKRASDKDGVWKFPKGDAYYQYRLAEKTTTDYTPDFIHKIGLMNVDRIHGEMKQVMKKVGFKGNLKSFFKFMVNDKRFYFSQNEKGRQKYLDMANSYIANIRTLLPKMFNTLPKAELEVLPVEAFREKTAGLAFYDTGAADGSRPGKYYVNLSNLKALPTWEAEALVHHEGLPGHHMQLSIAQEMERLPKFRRYMQTTAYIEGWGLYSEKLPLGYGAYKDPYSDFGRLSMELWRACRLVVDTGIHHKKWSRQKAIDYLATNTPSDREENIKAIDRYIVMPGQATAYMIGMLKISELRKKAENQMGKAFDLRQFHDVVLRSGAVPLNILEKNVGAYIKSQGSDSMVR